MTLDEMPKVELHLHLEGAAPPEFIRQLAQEKQVNLDGVFDDQGNYAFDGFLQFLKVYEAATAVLQTPQDYRRLTLAVLEQSASNGVIYTEAFVSPDFCGGGVLVAWRDYVQAMSEAADIAEKRYGIVMRAIVTRSGILKCERPAKSPNARLKPLATGWWALALVVMKVAGSFPISATPMTWPARPECI